MRPIPPMPAHLDIFLGLPLLALLAGCSDPPPPPVVPAEHEAAAPTESAESAALFTDRSESLPSPFLHDAGAAGGFTYPEILGPGVALFDMDGDGDLDLYLVQGGNIPGTDFGETAPNQLFRNDGAFRFTDVTETSGAGDTHYGQGVCAVDYDADGDQDLLLTTVGPLVLLRNDGRGHFREVTEEAGLGGTNRYGQAACFFDADGDGDLDLYVANYTEWKAGDDQSCASPSGSPDYCAPSNYAGATDFLYLSDGAGRFLDASAPSGIAARATRSMGVVAFDADGDGDADLYVGNDDEPNVFWINDGTGHFTDGAPLRGCAVNGSGASEGSMGIAAADVDADGDVDLYVTHLMSETNTYYENDGAGHFEDRSRRIGLGSFSRPDTGFGVGFLDFDLDGDLDVFVGNGGVVRSLEPRDPEQPYDQLDRLLRRGEDGRFTDITTEAGAAFKTGGMARGTAFGDLDGDGRIDVVVTNNRGRARILRNTIAGAGHSVAVRLEDHGANRDAIGAAVWLDGAAGRHWVQPHSSYLSSSEFTVRFGVGEIASSRTVHVIWPDGQRERFDALVADRVHLLKRGTGRQAKETD